MVRGARLGVGECRFRVDAIAVIDRDPTRPTNDFGAE
jgi:hypothetical protein